MVGGTSSDDTPGPSSSIDRRSLLSAASMVRQQSDTTGVRRLVRARAVQEEDDEGDAGKSVSLLFFGLFLSIGVL
uniref:Uncharacterized protein n=2 Tax=Caenorhabditis japonica TaxID=281687 RepID=A0A8R1IRJ7_CAEJA